MIISTFTDLDRVGDYIKSILVNNESYIMVVVSRLFKQTNDLLENALCKIPNAFILKKAFGNTVDEARVLKYDTSKCYSVPIVNVDLLAKELDIKEIVIYNPQELSTVNIDKVYGCLNTKS